MKKKREKIISSMISQNSLILHHFYYYAIVVKTAGLCARRSLVRTRSNLFGGSKGTIGISKPPGDFRFFTLHQIANTLVLFKCFDLLEPDFEQFSNNVSFSRIRDLQPVQ